MQSLPLWSIPIYYFMWDQHDQYRDDLVRVCHDLEDKKYISNVAPEAKSGLYESGFDFVSTPDPAVEALAHWTKNCFFQSAANANKSYWPAGMNVKIEIHESWCHITRDGGYHDTHIHANSSWSAIYYLDTGDMGNDTKNGVNRFYNPNHNMYDDAGTAWNTGNTSVDIQPRPGMLVIFPSWIKHSGMIYRGKQERIVISMNCQITKA
jgi:uncharacterized protein (TIGR02466 family)